MTAFLQQYYGQAEGPLGFPMLDKQARALDALLNTMPKDDAYRYRKAIIEKAPTEVLPGERSDVSWITTEDPDRVGDVVLAKGMNDSQFRQNPIVTLNHAYWAPPVGKSLWRKYVKDGELKGIKAKTQYPARPADWPPDKDWAPDIAFSLVQADMLRGKSIGFLPTKVHVPDSKEIEKNHWHNVGLVIDEWLLLEYACVFLPAQQNAVVESVGKERLEAAFWWPPGGGSQPLPDYFRKALNIPETKGPVAYDETAKADKERPWDADAAVGRLRKWAKIDDPNASAEEWNEFARGFAYVSGQGDKLGDFKLPHHDVIDGKLVVVYKGVVAAMAALQGARGGVKLDQPGDKQLVYKHLAKHYRQFGQEPPEPKACLEAHPSTQDGTEALAGPITPFTAFEEIERAITRGLAGVDFHQLAERSVQEALDRRRGRV